MQRPVFMTGSWRKSQETKSPPWRKETYGLPAWQMLVLVISPLCTLFMWWVTTRHPLFFPLTRPSCTHTDAFSCGWMFGCSANTGWQVRAKMSSSTWRIFLLYHKCPYLEKVPYFLLSGEILLITRCFFFLLHSLPNWPNLDQWWLNEHHYACVHESVESADLRLSVLADAKGRSLEASKRKLPC